VIVKEVEMAAGKPFNLGERVIDALGVERTPSGKEPVLVAERAMMRTPARDDDGIWHKVSVSLNKIPSNRRQTFKRPHG
jgi:hypothetical protein